MSVIERVDNGIPRTAGDHDPGETGIYVISRGGVMAAIAAADDPVAQFFWSQLALVGTSDPLEPPAAHRIALGMERRGAPIARLPQRRAPGDDDAAA